MVEGIELDKIDTSGPPPSNESDRQYYFMAKCRQYVKAESERLGRPLTSEVTTFGCQNV